MSNDARDLDLADYLVSLRAMVSYGFQGASRASNGRSNCGLCCVFLTRRGKAARIFERNTSLDVK